MNILLNNDQKLCGTATKLNIAQKHYSIFRTEFIGLRQHFEV
jgi:hypothetical protein